MIIRICWVSDAGTSMNIEEDRTMMQRKLFSEDIGFDDVRGWLTALRALRIRENEHFERVF